MKLCLGMEKNGLPVKPEDIVKELSLGKALSAAGDMEEDTVILERIRSLSMRTAFLGNRRMKRMR